jgi:hypothetical protein
MSTKPLPNKKADQRILDDAREWFSKQGIDSAILVVTAKSQKNARPMQP